MQAKRALVRGINTKRHKTNGHKTRPMCNELQHANQSYTLMIAKPTIWMIFATVMAVKQN
jgi:hypothetical protein